MTDITPDEIALEKPKFDDRIDIETRIGNLEVARILGRSLKLLASFPKLFFSMLGLSALAIIPGLYFQWAPKIIIDQVILQKPIEQTETPFPPHMTPLVNAITGLSPMETLVAMTIFLLVLLCIAGRGRTDVSLSQGEDSATQAENQINEGDSQTSGVIGLADTLVQIRLSQQLTNRLRTTLFQRMARLPMTTLDDHRIGDAVYRVMYDAPMLPGMCYQVTVSPLFQIIGAVISIYLMHYSYGDVAPELIWVAALMIPAALITTVPFSALARRVQQDSRAAGAATTNAIEESLGNISAVQSLGGMAREKDRIDKQSTESFRRYRHIKIVEIILTLVTMAIAAGMLVWVAIFTMNLIIAGDMSPGDFGVLFGIGQSLGFTAVGIGRFWINLQGNAAAVRRVFFFIDLPSEEHGESLAKVGPLQSSVQIENVDFTYPDGRVALTHINLTLTPGEFVAIVGPTGAGKTSLAFLIPAYISPTHGRVLFDGRDTSVLILDEPTAALDPQTENALVRALRAAAKDRLVIVIAHRLSTIRQADRIVFLEEGEIRDVGSHDELMAEANSRYRHFVELQRGA